MVFRFATLIVLLISPVFAWPNADLKEIIVKRDTVIRGKIQYVGCSSQDVQGVDKIQAHIQDAEKIADAAYKQAQAGNKYFDAFFGKPFNDRYEHNDVEMKNRFKTLSSIQTEGNKRFSSGLLTINCNYQNAPNKRCSSFGAPMMTELSTGTIWACASFFKVLNQGKLASISPPTPSRGLRRLDEYAPTGGLLLHEFTHAIWETMDRKLNSKKVMYGHERALKGVEEKGSTGFVRGRTNADSYRMFATAAYWSATRGTTWAVRSGDVGDEDL